ncbi:MAG: hypothetical protein DRN04_00780 [Thermoprotei archaeon]|nr:MAG: hypothetical protein DRN04_00780 [Thermoprotei archaeon]
MSNKLVLILALLLTFPYIICFTATMAPQITTEISIENIAKHIEFFVSLESRFVGTEGYYKAAEYIEKYLSGLGLKPKIQEFKVLVPVESNTRLTVGGEAYELYSVYPNLVAPSKAPPEGITGKLVYVGRGSLEEMSGKDIFGSIVLIDIDGCDKWINAMKLGAKAIIILETKEVDRLRLERSLTIGAPIPFPRFYAKGDVALKLIELAKKGVTATIYGGHIWKEVKGINIIATVEGSEYTNKVIYLLAHYDSFSYVPALSPGADEACGIATLLELARIIKELKPKFTVCIVAIGSHWQGLAGARYFVEEYLFSEEVGTKIQPYLAIGLDLSTSTNKVCFAVTGYMYAMAHSNLYDRLLTSIFMFSREVLNEFQQEYSDVYSRIESNELKNLLGLTASNWGSGYVMPYILDTEPFNVAGLPAFTFLTLYDMRGFWLTPFDTFDKVNLNNLRDQVIFISYYLKKLVTEATPDNIYRGSWSDIKPSRLKLIATGANFGYDRLIVEVVRYDPTTPKLYRPVPNAIVVVSKRTGWYSIAAAYNRYNMFAWILARADENGTALIVGAPSTHAACGNVYVEAYVVSDETGRLTYAPDEGSYGTSVYPHVIEVKEDLQRSRTVVFECSTLVVSDVIYPYTLQKNIYLSPFKSPTNPIPYASYDTQVSAEVLQAEAFNPLMSYGWTYDPLTSTLLVFAPPNIRFVTIIKFTGQAFIGAIVCNSTPEEPLGKGYSFNKIGEVKYITIAPHLYTKELLSITQPRYHIASVYKILDPALTNYFTLANSFLAESEASIKSKEYAKAYYQSLLAWGYALKAYERSRDVYLDAAFSITFALLIILPSIVLMEKLIGKMKGFSRITILVAIGIIFFTILWALHPGFSIIGSVPALITGTVVLVLVAPVLVLVISQASFGVSEIRKSQIGLHFLERSRLEMIVSALLIGIEHMKRRKLRTLLTLFTVIAVTFSLVSLTSVTPVVVLKGNVRPGKPLYKGILIESVGFTPIEENVIYIAKELFPNAIVCERVWVYPELGQREVSQSTFSLFAKNQTMYLRAIVGVSVNEKYALGDFLLTKAWLGGSWFDSDYEYACIVPKSVASALGLHIGDTVWLNGIRFIVKGIFDDIALSEGLIDLDGYCSLQPIFREELTVLQVFDPEVRVKWSSLVLIPVGIAKAMPGSYLASVAVVTSAPDSEIVKKAEMMYSCMDGLIVHAGLSDRVQVYAKAYVQVVSGFSMVIPLIVIGGLVILTTILGNTYERMKEAGILSALGLSPIHVSGMFFAENVVYALVGASIGYALGLIGARFFAAYHILPEYVGVNYTSTSVIFSIGMVIIMVLSASLYPFYKVSKLVTPSLERRWKPPTKPKGDEWEIPLPFTYLDFNEVLGLVYYLSEIYREHTIERAGAYTVVKHRMFKEQEKAGIESIIWLPPYELNIRQKSLLVLYRSKTEGKYVTTLVLKRLSGPYVNWVNSNLGYIDELRKQFLTWRLLRPEERRKYIEKALSTLR